MNLKSKILDPLYNLRYERITDKMWGEEIIITEPTVECWELLTEMQVKAAKEKNKGKAKENEVSLNKNNEYSKKITAILLMYCLRDSDGNMVYDHTDEELNALYPMMTNHHVELCNKSFALAGNAVTSSDPIGETEKK